MPLDPSIAMGYQPIKLENPMNSLAQMMQLEASQKQNQLADFQYKQAMQSQDETNGMNSLYAKYMKPDGSIDRAGFLQGVAQSNYGSKIPGLQKSFAEMDEKATKADAEKFKLASDRVKGYKSDLGALYQDPTLTKDKAVSRMQMRLQNGLISPEMYQHIVSDLPDDPGALREQLGQGIKEQLTPEQMLTLFAPKTEYKDNGQKLIPIQTNPLAPGYVSPTAIQKLQTPESQATERSAAANRQVQREGQDLTRQRLEFDKTKPVTPKASGPMSVTLQKELLESDDAVQSGKAIVSILQNALKINKEAYSGYAAKGRAVLASNLVPWQTQGADKTIDLDNMMTGQALESLKTVFGGMPTEGERKILLDMQASADKTPTQREAIITRAIAAAERRAAYAGQKAKAIRSGEYLSGGVQNSDAVDPVDSLLDKYK